MQSAVCNGNPFRGDQICINTGWADESSDFEIQALLQYDRTLSDAEVAQIELWLGYACPAGYYLKVSEARKSGFPCALCPAGSSSNIVGATSCTTCSAGSFSSAQGSTSCTPCNAGTYSSAGSPYCSTQCPAGSFSESAFSSCTPCPAGTASSAIGATFSSACSTCAAGSFSPSGAVSCTQCPDRTYSTFTGATSNSTCLPCPVNALSCPNNALPSCGMSPDCFASVLLRGGQPIDKTYFSSTSWPTLRSDGGYGFDRSLGQFLDGGMRTFRPGTTGFTATMIFNFTGNVGHYERLFDFGSGDANFNIIVAREATSNTMYFEIWNTFLSSIGSNVAIAQNTRYILTVVYSPPSFYSIYINGQKVATKVESFVAVPRTLWRTCIGGRSLWAGDAFLNGTIFHLAAYDRSLSTSDILQQHQCAASCTKCPVGSFCPYTSANAPVTFTCMAGHYCLAVGSMLPSVFACPAGSYSSALAATSPQTCSKCPAPKYSKAGSGTCPHACLNASAAALALIFVLLFLLHVASVALFVYAGNSPRVLVGLCLVLAVPAVNWVRSACRV
jgi:hypothetical protein